MLLFRKLLVAGRCHTVDCACYYMLFTPGLGLQALAKPSSVLVQRPERQYVCQPSCSKLQLLPQPTAPKRTTKLKEKRNVRQSQKPGLLTDEHPDLAEQWHPTLNPHPQPGKMTSTSMDLAWWYCPKTTCQHPHVWQTEVRQRAISHAGCPYCSGKLVCPCNSLSGQHPELAAQWDLRRNRGIRAEQTRPTSFDKAWWKHTWHHGGEEKMHGWMCRVSYRVKDPEGTSCPHCRSAAIRASLPPQPPKPKPPPEPKPKKVYDYTTPWAQIKKIRRIKALPAKKREKALKKLDQRQAAKDRVKAEKEAARAQAKAERAAEKARHRIERIWDMPSSSGSDGMHDA